MTTLREAAQQALEALHNIEWHGSAGAWMLDDCKVENAIHALRAALSKPVQEPVAWIYQNTYTEQEYLVWKKGTGGRNWRPLYTAPPQRKPLTEEELDALAIDEDGLPNSHIEFARAIERAHGIGGSDE